MILSHSLRLIFLKTRKVAGTSLEIALSAHCEDDDVITPFGGRHTWEQADEDARQAFAGRGAQNYEVPESKLRKLARRLRGKHAERNFWEHMSATDVRTRIAPAIWDEYCKVSIVRNPYDFAVSNYYWFSKTGRTDLSFTDFLEAEPNRLLVNRAIIDVDGAPATDVTLRYETLSNDVAALSERLGLGTSLSDGLASISAKGSLRPKSKTTADVFARNPGAAEIVTQLCAEDIARYGYDRLDVA
ncbi:hypothetical protein L0666_16855 [Octadecabacter sp. CECT 8868]|uniref:hypothetical protein n=1 Tax=Octadecabacter algicola TaxID=2909342 RepID=UPI001F34F936|nr:hypothetical protein [Octadecabacter algicola]MCF2906666.1 hypothetical protein [Octadecabacter algicola]